MLGFPCNQFGAQEPGTEAEILEFVTSNYDVDFPMFAKIDVNGADACEKFGGTPVHRPVVDHEAALQLSAEKQVLRNGQVVDQFFSYAPGNADPYLFTIFARVKDPADVEYVRDAILDDLRHQYVLGFPTGDGPSRFRRVQVEVKGDSRRTFVFRRGYQGPPPASVSGG